MFALLRAEAEQAGRYQSLAHFYSRSVVSLACLGFIYLTDLLVVLTWCAGKK